MVIKEGEKKENATQAPVKPGRSEGKIVVLTLESNDTSLGIKRLPDEGPFAPLVLA